MFKKDVLLVVPDIYRDLPGYAYISYILKNKYKLKTKILTDQNHIPSIHIPLYRPKVLFSYQVSTKYAETIFKIYKSKNVKIVSIRTEGTVNKMCEPIFKSHYDYKDIVDLQIYWGKSFEKLINSFNEIDPNKGISCGNPSFDFYNPSYSKFYLTRKEFFKLYPDHKYNFRKAVVIATNFVSTNKDINDLETIPEILDNPTNEEIGIFKKIINKDIQSRSIITNIINDMAIKYQDILFIIKVHPREEDFFYRHNLKNKSNILLFKDEIFLWDLINISDVLLHPGSTVSIPFKMMNKQTVLYNFSNENLSDNELWNSDKLLKTKDAFDAFFKNLLSNEKYDRKLNFDLTTFEKWFYKNDCNASKRCADEIYKVIKENTNNQIKINKIDFLKAVISLIPHIIYNRKNIINDYFYYNSVNKKIRKIYKTIKN